MKDIFKCIDDFVEQLDELEYEAKSNYEQMEKENESLLQNNEELKEQVEQLKKDTIRLGVVEFNNALLKKEIEELTPKGIHR